MKKYFKPAYMPVFSILAGILAMALRFWLFSSGMDEKGLLITNHISVYLTLGLLVLSVAALVILCRKLPSEWTQRPAGSLPAAICTFLAAVGMLVADILEFKDSGDSVGTVSFILGIFAAAALVWLGMCRFSGVKAGLLPHGLLSVYFMLHLIVQYRLWSAEPQALVYCFPLLASVCLMLCCYHRANLSVTGNGLRIFSFLNQLGLLLCCMSMTESWLFYGSMALWTASDLFFFKGKEETA